MKTKSEIIAEIKIEYPTLKIGDEDSGYTDLAPDEYEATISTWADNMLAQQAEQLAVQEAEAQKAAILAKLGITADELRIATS